jgi:signal peptidase II
VHDVQAARGTALADRSRLPLLLSVAGAVLALDLASKLLAVRALSDREPIELLGGLLTLRLVRNPGAAFGMAQGLTVVLTAIAVVVVVVILRMARTLGSSWWAVALGLVLGGALGNLVDRLFRAPSPGRGHVVDFLELPRWPVFNLADSAIVVAGVVMVVLSFRGVAHDGSHALPSEEAAGPDEGPEKSG